MADSEFSETSNDLRELQRNLADGVRAVQGGQVTGWLGKAAGFPSAVASNVEEAAEGVAQSGWGARACTPPHRPCLDALVTKRRGPRKERGAAAQSSERKPTWKPPSGPA